MSIVVCFNPKNVTREKYDEVIRRLEAAGAWPHPPGLQFHVLFGTDGELRVSEVWDSPESLEAYGETIFPIMLTVKVDKSDPTDLYLQVAGEIRRAIADGEAKSGERLPPAKDLAAVLGVNTNTVLRSLRVLRDEGLLEFRRGRGISVAGTPERGLVVQRAKELVEFARHHGYRLDELVGIIEDVG